ncbi:flavodoxin family protein [Cellulomonas rhizosphaerae]|uniref:Flavodoxin n=1 Tax=Cellulomonas rhizosphaerae TaxID=2293719 RepID=A0A413RH87_9CELL|nr:flavodoxin [Cellulomonas rhizosphaerae]RHA37142.1 flavodoxin [Cellulomonas rhizosphaerae]
MTALLVFESMYGSTAAIAEAIAAGLADVRVASTVCEVGLAPTSYAPSLLIVGAPTHQRGMSTPRSRETARGDVERTISPGDGVREWLDELTTHARGLSVAVFDTALPGRLAGSAAHTIARRFTRAGATLVVPPESFAVTGRSSGLRPEELERARQWGRSLALFATAAAS